MIAPKLDSVIKNTNKDGTIVSGTLGINKNKPLGYKMPVPSLKKGVKKGR